jgi:hypothetical protein
MSVRKSILSRRCGVVLHDRPVARLCLQSFFLLALVLAASAAMWAKDSLTAIILFDSPKGAAYVQVTGLTVNGKTELRICDGVAKIDRRVYDSLPRTQLAGAASLTRGADGVLSLSIQGKSACVVPSTLKFDTVPEFTPAEAGEQAVLQGVLASSSLPEAALPAFKPGVQVVFVLAPDAELAEFLRAQRANSIGDLQDFLSRFPNSTRAAEARNSIAQLHERAGAAALTQYQKLAAAHKPDTTLLKQAFDEAQAARAAVPGYAPAVRLADSVGAELDALCEQDKNELRSFQRALQDRNPGYSHLAAAKQHIDQLLGVKTDQPSLMNLSREIASEQKKLEATTANAESMLAARRYDDAVASLGPYQAFAGEVPRIDAVLTAGYVYHFNRGQNMAAQQDWEQAVGELRKAAAIRPNNQEAAAAVNTATTQMAAARNLQAANRALEQSKEYSSKGDVIEAYNVLAHLPDASRTLVSSQLAALSRDYVPAALRRAQRLQDAHIPIKGRADEEAVREAFEMLDRASSLSGDPAVKLKRDFLSGKISAYYIDQAKRYLDKPLGSGVAIGWLYLKEAQRYDTNLGIVKDQLKDLMASYGPTYQRRSRLSVGIVLRDQTSRRNSVGFADQMVDAIANGLDPSGVPVEIVRRPAETPDASSPNFLLVGEILEHRVVKNANLETLQSKYRAGTHEVKNPVWLQTNSDYEAAKQQLASAQRSLADAQAQHKGKTVIAAATDGVQQAQQHADELRHKLETTDPTRVDAVVEPYQYTKKTVDLTASIDLAFRVNDLSGNVVEPPVTVHKDNHKSVAVLENVKPEDTEGITNKSVEPDDAQFLTDLEVEARNALIKAVRERAADLPGKILKEARARAQRGDTDGAAEEFVLYLNSTPETSSPERDEATKFLHDQFNLPPPAASKL